MDSHGFYEDVGSPFVGRKRKKLIDFLKQAGLDYDDQIEYTINLVDDGEIVATGSIYQNVLKCIAVDEKYQGMGLSAKIVTSLMNRAVEKDQTHLFLFTKPTNEQMFSELGFYKIIATNDVLLMENVRNGIVRYVQSLQRPEEQANSIGAIVANCNPFTMGHRYLIEQAAACCDTLHVFLVSEDRSVFPTHVRYQLTKEGISDLENVILHETSDYLISSASFPTYFIRDKARASDANCELDIRIFCEFFARELGITKRFVGDEPFCEVTRRYNDAMRRILPEYNMELIEIPRKKYGEMQISASHVRDCILKENYEKIRAIVPVSTFTYITSEVGKEIIKNRGTVKTPEERS